MIRLWARRIASILAVALFLVAVVSFGTYYFYPLLVAAIIIQLLVQRATEIGWRIFQSDLDERQEALKARILELSYRWLIGIVLVGMLLYRPLVGLLGGFRYWGPPGPRYVLPPEPPFSGPILGLLGETPPYVALFAVLLTVIFFLPGVVAAWIEPVPQPVERSAAADS